MSENNPRPDLSWKDILRAAKRRLESDARTHVLPAVHSGRTLVGDALVALGRKLQEAKR